jgi:hypothetical protein
MTIPEEGSVGGHLDQFQSKTKEVEMHESLKMT